jgi:hypothetical protein
MHWKKTTLLLAVMLVLAKPSPARNESGCVACHAKEQGEYLVTDKDSMHAQAGIGCADCHGGDKSAMDKDAAHDSAAGFTGKIPRSAVPELCGNCHADVRRMNPYGLPTDQLAQYRTSDHGEKLFGGADPDVATCVDCHGAHGIINIKDPGSPVYPKNVPSTCGRCHGDQRKMEKHGLLANQPANYLTSVHAHLLLDRDDLSAPTCVTCHGNHGAVPPGFSKVEAVCGKCHVKQKQYFDQGPHAKPAQAGGIEACVTCHGNHKVLPADLKLFHVCTLCHSEGDKAFDRAKKIYTLLDDTRKNYDAAENDLAAAGKAGFLTEDEEVMMADAKTYLTQLAPLQHTMDLARLHETSGQVDKIAAEVKKDVAAKEKAARLRKLALVPLAGFMTIMSLGFWLKKRGLHGRAGGGP